MPDTDSKAFLFDPAEQREMITALRRRLSSHYQVMALDGWCRQVGEHGMLKRADIMRSDTGRAASTFALVEAMGDVPGLSKHFIHRVEGEKVVRFLGSSMGERFYDVYDPVYRFCIEPEIRSVFVTHEPRLVHVATEDKDGKIYPFRQLLLPVADQEGRVNMVLSVYDFRVAPNRYPSTGLSMHSALARAQNTRRRAKEIMGLS